VARYTYKEHRLWCETCKNRATYLFWTHEPTPPCRDCGGALEPVAGQDQKAACVIGDEIDVLIPHGLCHADGTPRRFTSKSELRAAEKAAGLVNYVRHVGERGSDKSKFTTRWV
jgi:hypothetical protein